MNLSFDIELQKNFIANADVNQEQTKFYDSNKLSHTSRFLTIKLIKI